MQINETTYNKMPAELQALFTKLPNPAREEVVGLFPQTKSGGGNKGNVKDGTGMFGNGKAFETPTVEPDSGSAARFFYCAKASKRERGEGNSHPTVKPISLMEYLVKLVSREGAVILDPFAGSGSTLLACKNLNRQYIGIEREQDYINIINARLGEPCGK